MRAAGNELRTADGMNVRVGMKLFAPEGGDCVVGRIIDGKAYVASTRFKYPLRVQEWFSSRQMADAWASATP